MKESLIDIITSKLYLCNRYNEYYSEVIDNHFP